MKLSYALVATLVGLVAASPLGTPSTIDETSIVKRFDKGRVDAEVKKLGDLIAAMQKRKDERKAKKGEGWQKTIDNLRQIKDAIALAPPEKAAEEINKLDAPLDRMRASRDENNDRRTKTLTSLQEAKAQLLDAAK